MANIKQAFEYAAKNPDSDFAKNLAELAKSGALNVEAKKNGIDLSVFQPQPEAPKRTLGEKVLDVTGGKEIAQGLGQGLALGVQADPNEAQKPVLNLLTGNKERTAGQQALTQDLGGNTKRIADTQAIQAQVQQNILAAIKDARAKGEDTTRLEGLLQGQQIDMNQTGQGAEKILNPNELTGKQVIGDALQLGTTITGVGSYSKAGLVGEKALTTGLQKATPEAIAGLTKGTGVLKGIGQGAKSGAITGSTQGFAQGVAQGLQEDKTLGDSLKQGVGTGIAGGIFGTVVGGLIGGVSGAVEGNKLRQSIIAEQEKSGLRPTLSETVKTRSAANPAFSKLVQEAKKQGYSEGDINFLSTVSESDKPTLKKMFDVTAKAQSNPRQIVRAADILGENATGIVKQVQSQNSAAGKLVDQTAKALKGQSFDASSIEQKVLSSLDDAGISLSGDGNIDFSQSIFKNTPELQKEIEKVLRTIPDGNDAYQAHIAKKSIDELINYGTKGEGLSGKSKSLLQAFRGAIDDALDSSFSDYNAANTEYKLTREFIDGVQNVVGKKVDFSTKAGAQSFGQAFRSAFSNNKSRGQTLALIEELQNFAKQRGLKGAEQNLLDQALYVNMLEDTFGSQAATGLASEVAKGVGKVKGAIGFIREPVSGTLNLVADAAEKDQNISPEAKKQILQSFVR